MGERDIDEQLKQLLVPDAAAGTEDQAVRHALQALEQWEAPVVRPRGLASPAWKLAGACAVLVLVLCIGLRHLFPPAPQGASWAEQVARDERVLQETLELFPDHLQAIVMENGETKIVLGEEPQFFRSQPLLVTLTRDSRTTRIVGFSGELVQAGVAQDQLTLELLVTAEGHVLLSGDDFFWSSQRPGVAGGYTIQAQPLRM